MMRTTSKVSHKFAREIEDAKGATEWAEHSESLLVSVVAEEIFLSNKDELSVARRHHHCNSGLISTNTDQKFSHYSNRDIPLASSRAAPLARATHQWRTWAHSVRFICSAPLADIKPSNLILTVLMIDSLEMFKLFKWIFIWWHKKTTTESLGGLMFASRKWERVVACSDAGSHDVPLDNKLA